VTRRRVAKSVVGVTLLAAASLLALAGCVWLRGVVGVSLVDGGSMRPALQPGDVLLYERRVPVVAAGDVVVFSRSGWPGGVAHRVIEVRPGDLLLTRGDANPVADRDPVPRARLVGRVVAFVPSGRAAGSVASVLRRWYTDIPIAHKATTERRLSLSAVTGIGLR
jgi:signal peptidase I